MKIKWKAQARDALKAYPSNDPKANVAVEFAIRMQREMYVDADIRLRIMDMVYFRKTHALRDAAIACNYSEKTVQHWNDCMLIAVYIGLAY